MFALGCAPKELKNNSNSFSKKFNSTQGEDNDLTHFLISENTLARYLVNDLRIRISEFKNHVLFLEDKKKISLQICEQIQTLSPFDGKTYHVLIMKDDCKLFSEIKKSFGTLEVQANFNDVDHQKVVLNSAFLKFSGEQILERKRSSKNFISGSLEARRNYQISWKKIFTLEKEASYRFVYDFKLPYLAEFKQGSNILHDTQSELSAHLAGIVSFSKEGQAQVILEIGELTQVQIRDVYTLDKGLRFVTNKKYRANLILTSGQILSFIQNNSEYCLSQNEIFAQSFSLGQPFFPVKSRERYIDKKDGVLRLSLRFWGEQNKKRLNDVIKSSSMVNDSILCASEFATLNSELFYPRRYIKQLKNQ